MGILGWQKEIYSFFLIQKVNKSNTEVSQEG